ncbi:site-specific integrase [Actinomadura sp. K4S16]|uniref:site-specific integrase n=1 Tax=Actinomadura sp. K4S16 TaxID=1316147 RepID=UPI0011EBA1EB|nr:site-specific integrase [Actinomadura sp. K4S16]
MAYAEKRGPTWRSRYKRPDGTWASATTDDSGRPFERKQDALQYGNDKEAEIRRAGPAWFDPARGEITVADWCGQWLPAQDLEDTTEGRYRYLIDQHIIPAFGERPLNSLHRREEIEAWEKRIRRTPKLQGRGTYSQRTASDARDLLSTILGDAMAAGYAGVNVAEKRRGRGRKRHRNQRSARSSQKSWFDPLGALLVAERCAIMSGRDDEFIHIVTLAWTGMRWGEALGLENEDVHHLDRIDLDWQLREYRGQFLKVPPKDDSARRIDKPPFLTDLLSRQMQNRATGTCSCRDDCGGSGRYLFLTAGRVTNDGHQFAPPAHHSRSNFGTWYWHPAIDGVYPEEGGKDPRPARPVLVDANTGRPLRPAWPYAQGPEWSPPRGRGLTRHDAPDALAVSCPKKTCLAPTGTPCTSRSGAATVPHTPRVDRASVTEGAEGPALASWLPLRTGLTPHRCRHAHEVWMQEDRIPDVLRHERMGHVMQGIKAVYSHVSPLMRSELRDALQKRWETALAQRADLDRAAGRDPHSPVAVLDELLQAGQRKPRLRTATA